VCTLVSCALSRFQQSLSFFVPGTMAPKGKAKKPLSAKAKAKLRAAKLAAKQAAIEAGEIPAVQPKKNDAFKKKLIAGLAGKSIPEAIADFKKAVQIAEAEVQEAEAMEKAQLAQVTEAAAEFEKAKAEIDKGRQQELVVAESQKEIVGKKAEFAKKVTDARNELYDAQKKYAMLEVLAVNHKKMKALEETRKKAQEAAQAARDNMLEQKRREKEALEATRKALAETRAEQKGLAAAKKRKVHPDEADTLPATQADQAADID